MSDQINGERLKRLRQTSRLTQEALAQRARLSASTIAKLEQGQHNSCHYHTTQRLARALRIDEEELLHDAD